MSEPLPVDDRSTGRGETAAGWATPVRRLRVGRVLALMGVVGAAVWLGWWAGRAVLVPPEDPLGGPEPVTYTVGEGSVGHSLSFVAVAEWEPVRLARTEAVGVVTSVGVEPGSRVSAGDVLFEVGLRPVIAAEGTTPAFRDLNVRDRGDDVAQLQELLASLGFFDGETDGVFGSSTGSAVRAWQRWLGVADDGVVPLGDVVFVSDLPARVVLGEEVAVGARLGGGEETVWGLPADPSFWVPLTPEQRSVVPIDAAVMVTYGEGVWAAETVRAVESDGPQGGVGELRLVLEAAGGGSVCGAVCADWVPIEGRSDFPADIVVVPETAGPVVPLAAIQTGADGSTFVTGTSGDPVAVEVVASHAGLAVVDGVETGDVLLLPFESPPDPSP